MGWNYLSLWRLSRRIIRANESTKSWRMMIWPPETKQNCVHISWNVLCPCIVSIRNKEHVKNSYTTTWFSWRCSGWHYSLSLIWPKCHIEPSFGLKAARVIAVSCGLDGLSALWIWRKRFNLAISYNNFIGFIGQWKGTVMDCYLSGYLF